jgi:hypothetical protein
MLVLKRVKGWSFEETEREVRKNLVYRRVARVYFERVPDAKTLVRLSAVIGADGIEAIHRRLVEMAREQGLVKGQRARVDTTVVETNIRYPTDSRLLADRVRVLTRGLKRIQQATGVVGAKLRNRVRATTHRVLEIARAARSRNPTAARPRLERGYARLVALVRRYRARRRAGYEGVEQRPAYRSDPTDVPDGRQGAAPTPRDGPVG